MRKIDLRSTFIHIDECIRVTTETRKKYMAPSLVRHQGYELLLIDSGSCTVQIEQKRYCMERNDCIFISENEHHCVHVPGACTFTYIGMRPGQIFNNRSLLDIFMLPFLNGIGGGSHQWTGQAALVTRARALAQAARKSPPDVVAVIERLLQLMRVFSGLKYAPRQRSMADRMRIQPAMELIYSQYDTALTVQAIAQACSMSRSTFKRVFRTATGKSAKSFLDEHRLQQSANLLMTTSRKVEDIARSTGFLNLTNFNRRFLKRFGKAPSRFRK